MKSLVKAHIINQTTFHRCSQEIRPLITVTNHLSALDDPLLFGLLSHDIYIQPHRMRWTLGSRSICFKNRLRSAFFGRGNVIPTHRGDGIFQPAVDTAIRILNEGGWIHIFPEGCINESNLELIRFRWGIGRLVLETKTAPVILPIWHDGFQKLKPLNQMKIIPGHSLTVVFGDPIDSSLLRQEVQSMSSENARSYIAAQIQLAVHQLKVNHQ
jgi:monolysocardiolipin acyltransferase